MTRSTFILIGSLVAVVLLLSTLFIVHQTEQVLITRFGQPIRVIQEPGLKAKLPFVDNAITFDKRLLEFNARSQELNMVDDEGSSQRVVVDAFVKYRIVRPLQFYQSVRDEQIFNSRLESILSASMREVLGQVSLSDLLSERRIPIMRDIRQEVNRRLVREAREVVADIPPEPISGEAAAEALNAEPPMTPGLAAREPVAASDVRDGFGIDVIDVRINRADLPDQISESVFQRMRADFAEEAQKFRSEGQEESLRISSTAERERTAILAEANRQAEEVRGGADAQATRIFAEAFNRDPDFFEFYRTLQTYRETLKSDDTRLVLSPDSEFLQLFNGGR